MGSAPIRSLFDVTPRDDRGASLARASRCPSAQFGEILLPELVRAAAAGGAVGRLGAAQLDPADLARDGFRQLREFEPPHPFDHSALSFGSDRRRSLQMRPFLG